MRRACETAKAVEEVLNTGDVDVHCDLCEVSPALSPLSRVERDLLQCQETYTSPLLSPLSLPICSPSYIYIYICTYYTYIYIYIYIHMCNIIIYRCICIYVCICVYMYYICMYIGRWHLRHAGRARRQAPEGDVYVCTCLWVYVACTYTYCVCMMM